MKLVFRSLCIVVAFAVLFILARRAEEGAASALGSGAALSSQGRVAIRYQVTQYSGGNVVGSWGAISCTLADGKAFLQIPGNSMRTVVAGTFVVEPSGSAVMPGPAMPNKYRITLYSSGKAVRVWETPYYPIFADAVVIQMPGVNDRTMVNGTYAVEVIY